MVTTEVGYFNSLINALARETFLPGTKLDEAKKNQLLGKAEGYLKESINPSLYDRFVTAKNAGLLVIPEELA